MGWGMGLGYDRQRLTTTDNCRWRYRAALSAVVCLRLRLSLQGIRQHARTRVGEMQDQFAEERVGPGEPGAREVLGIVLLEGLMEKMGTRGRVAQSAEAGADLLIVGAGKGPEKDGHGPDVVEPLVRATDSLARLAAEE